MQRLTESWCAEHAEWIRRDLSEVDYVYIWADGIYPKVRLRAADQEPGEPADELCLLVIVGVRADGTKEMVGVEDG